MLKKGIVLCILVLQSYLFYACVSIEANTQTPQERENANIIGSVTASFHSTQFVHIINKSNIEKKAYAMLKQEAQRRYPGNNDIVNITMAGGFSGWNLLWGSLYFISPVLLNVQKITATGDVVQHTSSATRATQSPGGIDQVKLSTAIVSVSQTLIDTLPRDATIAVLSVTSPTRDNSEYIIDELEYKLVNSGRFRIVDRRRLDQIRSEQNFQISGDVDDDSAVSIGYMLGASIVLTGTVTVTGTSQLSIRALDVRTGQIISMAREQF